MPSFGMITMIITVLIFCTVVTGIAGMQDLKKVGRVGGKALLYFEIVSTIALVVGLHCWQRGSSRQWLQWGWSFPRATPSILTAAVFT